MSDDSTKRYGTGNHKPLPSLEIATSALALDAASPSGLSWKIASSRCVRPGGRAGTLTRTKYWAVRLHGTPYRAHRVIWLMQTGTDPGPCAIDHINGDRSDNRIENLRLAAGGANQRNRRSHQGSSSRFKGVSLIRRAQRWQANICANGKAVRLGHFPIEHHAARAYDRAAIRLHGEFARLNFPLSDYIETH